MFLVVLVSERALSIASKRISVLLEVSLELLYASADTSQALLNGLGYNGC